MKIKEHIFREIMKSKVYGKSADIQNLLNIGNIQKSRFKNLQIDIGRFQLSINLLRKNNYLLIDFKYIFVLFLK